MPMPPPLERRFRLDRLTGSAVALVVTFAVGVAYLLVSVLGVPLTGRADEVTVHMTSTGGLFKGSPVTYRGSRVGVITDIGIEKQGAVATFRLLNDVKVPRKSTAMVRSLSPVGEQYLDIQPESADGPYLGDGDEIEASAVDLPVTVASAAGNLRRLLGNIDDKDIHVVLKELDLAVSDSGDDLETLLNSSNELVSSLDEAWPRTEELLKNGREVGEVFAAHDTDLVRFARAARQLTAYLRKFDPEFRKILRNSPKDFETVGLLVRDLGPLLPALLNDLEITGKILHDREPHLRALSTALPYGIGRFASVFQNGWMNIYLLMQGQDACSYGTPHRDPQSTNRHAPTLKGHCGPAAPWRGANHVPPPTDR